MRIDNCICFTDFDAWTQNWCDEAETERFLEQVAADANTWTYIAPAYMKLDEPERKMRAHHSDSKPGWIDVRLVQKYVGEPDRGTYESLILRFKYDNASKRITAYRYNSATVLYREKPVQPAL